MYCHVASIDAKGLVTPVDVLRAWKLVLKNYIVNVEPAFYILQYLAVQNHQLVISPVPDREHVNTMLTTTVTRAHVHHVLFYARNGAMGATSKDPLYFAIKTISVVDYLVEKTCTAEDTNVTNLATTALVLLYATSLVQSKEDCVVIFVESLVIIHLVRRAVASKK